MSPSDDNPEAAGTPDRFYHGVVSRLFPSNNMGLIRGQSGREVPFVYNQVILLGEIKKPQDLKEGRRVGYDLGWTSRGLRVTKIKTYQENPVREDWAGSEGKGSKGEDSPS